MVSDEPRSDSAEGSVDAQEDYIATPWHFKLLVLAFVLYLIYRAVQAAAWLIERF